MNLDLSFKGAFQKFATTIDGGAKITFEIPQSEIHKIYELLESQGTLLKISVEAKDFENQ